MGTAQRKVQLLVGHARADSAALAVRIKSRQSIEAAKESIVSQRLALLDIFSPCRKVSSLRLPRAKRSREDALCYDDVFLT